MCSTEERTVTSTVTASAWLSPPGSDAAADNAAAPSMSASTTSAPSLRRTLAMPSPIPSAPPVTTATWPSMLCIGQPPCTNSERLSFLRHDRLYSVLRQPLTRPLIHSAAKNSSALVPRCSFKQSACTGGLWPADMAAERRVTDAGGRPNGRPAWVGYPARVRPTLAYSPAADAGRRPRLWPRKRRGLGRLTFRGRCPGHFRPAESRLSGRHSVR